MCWVVWSSKQPSLSATHFSVRCQHRFQRQMELIHPPWILPSLDPGLAVLLWSFLAAHSRLPLNSPISCPSSELVRGHSCISPGSSSSSSKAGRSSFAVVNPLRPRSQLVMSLFKISGSLSDHQLKQVTENSTSRVCFGAVEIQCWHGEWIERLLRQWASCIENSDRVVFLKNPPPLLIWSKSCRIVILPMSRRETQVAVCRPPVITHACRLWGLIELSGIHIDEDHHRTQMLKCTKMIQKKSDLSRLGNLEGKFQVRWEDKKGILIRPRLPGDPLQSLQLANSIGLSSPPHQDHQSPISRHSPHTKMHALTQLSAIGPSYSIHIQGRLSFSCALISPATCLSLRPSERSTSG